MLFVPRKAPEPMASVAAVSRRPLPLVSVVVACYGALRYTPGLVDSLRANAGCAYELLVMDDACPEETWRWCEAHGVRCIRHTTNQGLPRTLNEGVAATSGELVALWNNDLIVKPDGLRRLAEAALTHGFAGQSGGFFRRGGHYVDQTADATWADYPEGYCLVTRRDVWDAVGGWDPLYHPTNCDDSDWALRARLKGYGFALVPDCVHHIGQGSTSGVGGFSAVVEKNQAILRDRYARYGLGERILVQRWGAAGDLLLMTPALRALKRAYPLSRLHVHCHGAAGQVLVDLPYVDAVFERQPSPSRYSQVYSLNGAYEASQASGGWEHPVKAFCRAASVEDDGRGLDLRIPTSLQKWAAERLPEGRARVAAVLRSGCRPKSNWRAAAWAELADQLPEGALLVALDAEPRPALGPWELADEARFYAHPRVLDLTGETPTILHAAALLQQCRAAVSVDTGLLHAAAALGVPAIGLFGGVPSRSRLVHPLHSAFDGQSECFPCQAPTGCARSDGRHCLDYVSGSAAARRLRSLLEEKACLAVA